MMIAAKFHVEVEEHTYADVTDPRASFNMLADVTEVSGEEVTVGVTLDDDSRVYLTFRLHELIKAAANA